METVGDAGMVGEPVTTEAPEPAVTQQAAAAELTVTRRAATAEPAKVGADSVAGPSVLRRFVVAPFRAGLLGTGVFLWTSGVLLSLRHDGILSRGGGEEPLVTFALLLAVVVALARGYRGPLRSYRALLGRFVGGWAGAIVTVVALVIGGGSSFQHLDGDERPAALSYVGAILAVAAFAWIHGRRLLGEVRASRRIRIRRGAVAAVLGLGTVWVTNARVRCSLGSGQGCLVAASGLSGLPEDEGRVLALAERGCSLDSAECCRIAGEGTWRHVRASPTRRARPRAERFFRAACVLGDDEGCRLLHAVELDVRCEAYQASACHELADVCRAGGWPERDFAAADRYLRQACLLGDGPACADAR